MFTDIQEFTLGCLFSIIQLPIKFFYYFHRNYILAR